MANKPPRLVVVGGGPIGLEAALYAAKLQLSVTLYERAAVGAHLRQWGHVRLFSPFGMNHTPLGAAVLKSENPQHILPAADAAISGHEHLAVYLEPLARSALLRDVIQTGTEVRHIGRRGLLKNDNPGDARRAQHPFLLQLSDGKQESTVEADVVLDCTGTYGQHRLLGEGGIPARGEAAHKKAICYGLDDILGGKRDHYAGRNVLVLGSGFSAATSVCNLAALAEQEPTTWVVWLSRKNATPPIKRIINDPLPERDRVARQANMLATRSEGNVEYHPSTVIEAIEREGESFRVHTRSAGKPMVREVERIIANVGFTPQRDLYRELQVHECYASFGPMGVAAALLKQAGGDCLSIGATGPASLRTPEPNFYVLGAKSYGRSPDFLLRAGFEQVRDVFTLIMGQANLDLYKKA